MSKRGDEIWIEEVQRGSTMDSPGQRIANRLAEAEQKLLELEYEYNRDCAVRDLKDE